MLYRQYLYLPLEFDFKRLKTEIENLTPEEKILRLESRKNYYEQVTLKDRTAKYFIDPIYPEKCTEEIEEQKELIEFNKYRRQKSVMHGQLKVNKTGNKYEGKSVTHYQLRLNETAMSKTDCIRLINVLWEMD